MITEEHYKQLDKMLSVAVANEDLLTDWENGFVSEWADKMQTYQQNVKISDKQQAIFDKIESKLRKAQVL